LPRKPGFVRCLCPLRRDTVGLNLRRLLVHLSLQLSLEIVLLFLRFVLLFLELALDFLTLPR